MDIYRELMRATNKVDGNISKHFKDKQREDEEEDDTEEEW